MKGFKTLVIFGVFLVTLLVFIETIDAERRQLKKKENENKNAINKENPKNEKYLKVKRSDSFKQDKSKKSNTYSTLNLEENYNQFNEEIKLGKKKQKNTDKEIKKRTKYTITDNENLEEENPKITKTYQTVKKYKVIQDEPAQHFPTKTKGNKVKSQGPKEEIVDEILKSMRKTQKKSPNSKDNIEELYTMYDEELNKMYDEEYISGEEDTAADNPKKKNYKLVAVILAENIDEDKEGNETIIEEDSEEDELARVQRTESEEVIEKIKTVQTLKLPRNKRSLEKFEETPTEEQTIEEQAVTGVPCNDAEETNSQTELDEDSTSNTPANNGNPGQRCKPTSEDTSQKGLRRITFYIIEEVVNGQKRKRVIPEAHGVTMCEIADLLKKNHEDGLL